MRIRFTNQSGIAALAIVGIIVVVAAVAGAGYFVFSRNSNSSSETSISKEEQKAIEAECKKEIDDKDFCKFASNFTLDGEYKMTVTSYGDYAGAYVLETDDKGNSSTKAESPEGVYEFVQYNNATYTRESGDDTWVKFPESPETDSITSGIDDVSIDESDFADFETAEYVAEGKEACGNLTCFKYKILDSASPELTQYLYFDDKDYKLRKFASYEAGKMTDEGTIEYVDVSISEPTPFEEFDVNNFNVDELQNLDLNN